MVRRLVPLVRDQRSTSTMTASDSIPSRTINLQRGHPNPALLPAALLAEATAAILADPATATPALLYGLDPGYGPLLDQAAIWMSAFYGPARSRLLTSYGISDPQHGTTPSTGPGMPQAKDTDRLAITGGASQSLGVILASLTDPGYTQHAWLFAPSYFMVFKIFADAGLNMRAVPEGPDAVPWLRAALSAADAAAGSKPRRRSGYKSEAQYPKLYRHVIYCVPSFSNPSGATMPLAQREALVQVARDFDALILCDDVYDMLQWPLDPATNSNVSSSSSTLDLSTAPLPRLVDIDRHLPGAAPAHGYGNVLSNGSFSKLCAPGVRTGWVEAAPPLAHAVSQAGTTKSGGAPSQYAAAALAHALSSGALQRHIAATLRPAYARRYAALLGAVRRWLVPLGVTVPSTEGGAEETGRAGGYFTWLRLPEGLPARMVAERAKAKQALVVAPGRLFMVPGSEVAFEAYVRLCFAWEEEEVLAEGVRRLGVVVEEMLADLQAGTLAVEEKEGEQWATDALG